MKYFLIEPFSSINLPSISKNTNKDVIIVNRDINFDECDYDIKNNIISDRFKNLIEMYLPKYQFLPIIFLSEDRSIQSIYWKFEPINFENLEAKFRNDGKVSHIKFKTNKMPIAFSIISKRGVKSIVVKLPIAESALRRGILGLKFTEVQKIIDL